MAKPPDKKKSQWKKPFFRLATGGIPAPGFSTYIYREKRTGGGNLVPSRPKTEPKNYGFQTAWKSLIRF